MNAELLDQPHLSFVSQSDDPELDSIRNRIAHSISIGGRAELEKALCDLLGHGRRGAPKTLDLIGHSAATTSLLVIGDWAIDASSPIVTAFFRELADQNVLPRLGIEAVRLLGCTTAETIHGKWTICALAEILGVEVVGTSGPLLASHYDESGFAHERRYLLVSSTQLGAQGAVARPAVTGRPATAALDVDSLPAVPLENNRPWPVHVVSKEQARELLALVRRRDGSVITSLIAPPSCELALPSSIADRYHRLEVILDGELVRVHSHGGQQAVVYPVRDPATFRQLIAYASRR